MAVKIFRGKPIEFLNSGMHFLPYVWLPFIGLLWELVTFTKKMFQLSYKEHSVVSKKGRYPAGPDGEDCNPVALEVDSVAYVSLPRDARLIMILEAGVPTDQDALLDWTEEAVINAVRVAFGNVTWREATQNLGTIIREVSRVFQAQDGALIKAGFKEEDIRIVIQDVRLPPDLEAALPEIDKARIRATAAELLAEGEALTTTGVVVAGMAHSRGKTKQAMQAIIDGDEGLQKQLFEASLDLINRSRAVAGKALLDIRTPDVKGGVEGVLLTLTSLIMKGFGGGALPQNPPAPDGEPGGPGGTSDTGKKGKKKRDKKDEDEDDEDEEDWDAQKI